MKAYENDTLAKRIIAAMQRLGFIINPNMNIVYVEGMDTDGLPNANRHDAFDCVRCIVNGSSHVLLGIWDATTHPGIYWTTHRMNPAGAFIIRLGQQTCWTMGNYHDQPALIQTEPIEGFRDADQTFERKGGVYYRGLYGVHHHGGYNYPHDHMGRSSAGCQVGRLVEGHKQFIDRLKHDPLYINNHDCLWTSTVLTAEQVRP